MPGPAADGMMPTMVPGSGAAPAQSRARELPRRAGAAPLALLFGSGAVALVYECLWLRRFTTLFGATAPAAAATVSAVFAGFALGSAWFGTRAPRWRRPLRVYALLELGAGAAALFVLACWRGFEQLAPWLYARIGEESGLLLAAKCAQVFLAVLPATFLLGGTLPVLTQAVDDGSSRGGPRAARLYAANTLGGVAGALAVPFLLLPALGALHSYGLAVAASSAIAACAWWLDRRAEPRDFASAKHEVSGIQTEPPALRSPLFVAFSSGLLTLGLEVVWMRMLSQVHENSVHAFAIVLAVFLAALFGGAALGSSLARNGRDARRTLARIWLASGLLTLAAPAVFVPLTGGLDYLPSTSAGGYFGQLFLVCVATFVPATLCAGMVFPMLLALSSRADESVAPRVGRLLAANTAGAIAGPLVTSFALFPWLGSWGSAVTLGLGQMAMSLGPLRGGQRIGAPWIVFVIGLTAAWLAYHVSSLPRVHLDRERHETVEWIREGSHGVASAIAGDGGLSLKLDNFYTLGGIATLGDTRQLGHIPLVLHAAPRRVAFLGLGTGITASAAFTLPFEELTVFELVPEVVAAAREVFLNENHHLLEDRRVHLVIDDARSHLRVERSRYDVIVGDLVVPWRRGESSLHTREHFAAVRRALAPGGLFCQWLPLFQMSEEEFRIVAATFLDVFPSATLWRSDFVAGLPALGLIGREQEMPLDAEAIDERMRALAPLLADETRYMVHPAGLWLHLVGELDASLPWVASTRRNTEDLPWLELLSARTHLAGGARGRELFVGAPLLRFVEELGARPASGPLAALDAAHLRWRELGEDLFRASTLAESGADEGARSLAFATLRELPLAIQDRILGRSDH